MIEKGDKIKFEVINNQFSTERFVIKIFTEAKKWLEVFGLQGLEFAAGIIGAIAGPKKRRALRVRKSN